MRASIEIQSPGSKTSFLHLEHGQSWILGSGYGVDQRVSDASLCDRHLRLTFEKGVITAANLSGDQGFLYKGQLCQQANLAVDEFLIVGRNKIRVLALERDSADPFAAPLQDPFGAPSSDFFAPPTRTTKPSFSPTRALPEAPVHLNCHRCGQRFEGSRAQRHWASRGGDPSLLVCQACVFGERYGWLADFGFKVTGRQHDYGYPKPAFEVWSEESKRSSVIQILKPELSHSDPESSRFIENFGRLGSAVGIEAPFKIRSLQTLTPHLQCLAVEKELVTGGTLEKRFELGWSPNLWQVVTLGWQCLTCLEACHAQGIVHGSLNPQVLSFVNEDPSSELRITRMGQKPLEFWLAPTPVGPRLGVEHTTLCHLAPEALDNAFETSVRSDLYSLGVVLYRMLTGRLPFEAESTRSLVMQILKGEYPAIRTSSALVPVELEAVVARLMALNPQDRFASAAEARSALEAASR